MLVSAARCSSTVDGATERQGRPAPHRRSTATSCSRPTPSGAWKVTAYDMAVTRSGGGLDTPTTSTAHRRPRRRQVTAGTGAAAARRPLLTLLLAPLALRRARRRPGHRGVAAGRPSPVPRAGAVWFQVHEGRRSARHRRHRDQPFFVLALGTGARSDDPAESPDDPGLADAIHVIGVNPALRRGDASSTSRADTEGPGGHEDQLVHRELPAARTSAAAADAVSSVVGVPTHLR